MGGCLARCLVVWVVAWLSGWLVAESLICLLVGCDIEWLVACLVGVCN